MEPLEQDPTHNENLLDDVGVELIQAGGGPRFCNLLIDGIIRYLLWRFILSPLAGTLIVLMGLYTEDRFLLFLEIYVFALAFDVLILAVQEALMGGKTIGKWITQTRAVNEDGTPINFKTAFLRALSRSVPFEAFSALGSPCYPWHDRWTRTLVIDDRGSRLPV